MGALWPEPRRNALCHPARSAPNTALGYGCLRQSFSEVWWQEVNPADYGGQWGGEVAAALLGTVLKPQQSLLYLQPEAMRLGLSSTTVPIPLVITDLLASLDSRNIEAARELRCSWINNFKPELPLNEAESPDK
jgi:hypothetical protein